MAPIDDQVCVASLYPAVPQPPGRSTNWREVTDLAKVTAYLALISAAANVVGASDPTGLVPAGHQVDWRVRGRRPARFKARHTLTVPARQ